MTTRDQLATLIRDTVMNGEGRVDWDDIADAVIAAGWQPSMVLSEDEKASLRKWATMTPVERVEATLEQIRQESA